jgi:hypothetical protein
LPNGRKYWRIKHRFNGRERIYSIGVFPKISAAEAFKAAKHVRGLIREGVLDPMVAKKQAILAKQIPIPQSVFLLALSQEGALALETDDGLLTLTPNQTIALRGFLGANLDGERQ